MSDRGGRHPRRILGVPPMEQRHPETARVHGQLFHRPAPERVARRDQRIEFVRAQEVRDFREGRALAHPVDAHDHHDERTPGPSAVRERTPDHVRVGAGCQNARHPRLERRAQQRPGVADGARSALGEILAHPVGDVSRHVGRHVGIFQIGAEGAEHLRQGGVRQGRAGGDAVVEGGGGAARPSPGAGRGGVGFFLLPRRAFLVGGKELGAGLADGGIVGLAHLLDGRGVGAVRTPGAIEGGHLRAGKFGGPVVPHGILFYRPFRLAAGAILCAVTAAADTSLGSPPLRHALR
mmetsp:Transcript_42455/g.83435  ORF Transcript_42455/g.83435 Transcript_42455/m.83435 type:complete len:293 (+) Transcript_42455:518-1396(+)